MSRAGRAGARRPLVGVTTSEVRRAGTVPQMPRSDPPRLEMALGLVYLRALEAAGALPLVMPPMAHEAIEPLLDRLDGICLSGGPDLDPETYEAKPDPHLGPIEPDLDRFELEIARRADDRAMPILAICRGMQALNVARGGTLHQHLPDLDGTLDHRQREPGDVAAHEIALRPSHLAEALGTDRLEVNSFHHQAIDRLGDGLSAVAESPDGIIEGVEDPDRQFLIGVQWHAEAQAGREPEASLFRRFVESCADGTAVGC
jgi:putative glutamine amidotransferase